ncbi:MAG: nitrate reductase associated protein [Synechococcus sp.]|nr:nitrate reductase associated protein [Synechococcus sp.]
MAAEIEQASHCFAFEQDFVGTWRCIPLCVRRKLDLMGLKLKLSHWLALEQPQRQTLVDWGDSNAALDDLREHLLQCTRVMADGEAKTLSPAQGEAWQRTDAVPEALQTAARAHGVELPLQRWAGLNELERFALCKLARPGHDHHNLPAAFTELLA